MVQKVNFNNLTGDSLTIGNTTISGTGVTVGGAPLAAGATQYANTSQLPKTNLNFGEFALVGNTLYITNSVGWYSVALINQSPSLSISVSDIALGTSGNTINFTYTASDPDGPTPTVTLETTANTTQANVTLHSSNNTVTVENLSADAFSATITLTASDGIDMTYGTVALNVAYGPVDEWNQVLSSFIANGDDLNTFNPPVVEVANSTPLQTFGDVIQQSFSPHSDKFSLQTFGNSSARYYQDNNNFVFGTGEFCIDFWCKLHLLDTGTRCIATMSSPDDYETFWFGTYSTGPSWYFLSGSGSAWTASQQSTTPPVKAGEWFHVAITRTGGNTLNLYINGTLTISLSHSISYTNANKSISFGGRAEGGGQYSYCSIYNARVIKGNAVYRGNFTPPTEETPITANTVLMGCMTNDLRDLTGNCTLLQQSQPGLFIASPEARFKRTGFLPAQDFGCCRFDGDEALYTTVANAPFVMADKDFTIEAWAMPWYKVTQGGIFANYRTEKLYGTDSQGIFFGFHALQSYRLSLYLADEGAVIVAPSNVTYGHMAGQWNHYAIERKNNGDNTETWTMFVGGEIIGTYTRALKTFSAREFCFGHAATVDTGYGWNGPMTDMRISQGLRYNSTAFTPPTKHAVADNDTKLLIRGGESCVKDLSGALWVNGVAGTILANTSVTNNSSASLYFGGGDSRVQLGFDYDVLGSSDFTLEAWVYPTNLGSNYAQIWTNRGGASAATDHLWAGFSVAGYLTYYDADIGSQFETIAQSVPNNQWSHCVWQRRGTTVTLYLNGTSIGSATTDQSYSENGDSWFGSQSAYPFIGNIEQLQLVRYAKYNGNFTPPGIQSYAYQATS